MAGGGGAVACGENGGLVTCKETGGALACADGKPCSPCQKRGKQTPVRVIVTVSGVQNLGRYYEGDWTRWIGDKNGTYVCEQVGGCSYSASKTVQLETGTASGRQCDWKDEFGEEHNWYACDGNPDETVDYEDVIGVTILEGSISVSIGFPFGSYSYKPAQNECAESFSYTTSVRCRTYCGGCTGGLCGDANVTVTFEY